MFDYWLIYTQIYIYYHHPDGNENFKTYPILPNEHNLRLTFVLFLFLIHFSSIILHICKVNYYYIFVIIFSKLISHNYI